jgi:hypothetical protein
MSHMPSFGNPGSGTWAAQAFTHTCTGAEGDSFPIALPAPRHSTTYIAAVTLLSSPASSQALYNAPPANYTTSQITVLGPPPGAGDVLGVVITEIQ